MQLALEDLGACQLLSLHCEYGVWPRGTVFSLLPSVVISIVDHPSGSFCTFLFIISSHSFLLLVLSRRQIVFGYIWEHPNPIPCTMDMV
jgi:hypothetical protein